MLQTKSTAALWPLIAASSLFAACTTPNIHKTDNFGLIGAPVETLSIDAKQRVVVMTKGASGRPTITCAEPSPDALSALSTSVGGSLQDPKVAANFAIAQVESSASIGLRTQSIQLLRDGMYRLCEGYAGGALDGEQFNKEQRRYQNLMLSLLAIEQLTGAVAPRQAGLGEGSATTSVADNADEAAANATKASDAVADAGKALKQAQDTQTTDETACKAANDPTNKSCTAVSDDKTAVASKQSDLDTANKKLDTAKQALQAARGAVKAAAAGARVSFSEAPQTNQITDNSARYVAEATRTIVSTTLIASFAQEECANVWDFVKRLETTGHTADYFLQPQTTPKGQESEFVHMIMNCQASQTALLNQVALFTPQSGAPPAALQVLGGQDGVTLAPKDSVHLIIVGGVLPYHLNDLSPDLKKDLTAVIPHGTSNGAYEIHLSRPDGATKQSGTATIYVADSANGYVEVPVTFSKTSGAASNTSRTATQGGNASVKITDVSSSGGSIAVKITVPSSIKTDNFTAAAKNADKSKNDTLTGTGDGNATEVDIKGCTDGDSYNVALSFVLTGGRKTQTTTYKPAVKCSAAAGVTPDGQAPPKTP